MRAWGVFAEMSGGGVNSKKNAVGAIWAPLYAILGDGSQKVRDLSKGTNQMMESNSV